MHLSGIPFGITDWHHIDPVERAGEVGVARSRTQQFGTVRVRLVEYSAGYRANHWCQKGHILFCVAGELETELADGRLYRLRHAERRSIGGMLRQAGSRASPPCGRHVPRAGEGT